MMVFQAYFSLLIKYIIFNRDNQTQLELTLLSIKS